MLVIVIIIVIIIIAMNKNSNFPFPVTVSVRFVHGQVPSGDPPSPAGCIHLQTFWEGERVVHLFRGGFGLLWKYDTCKTFPTNFVPKRLLSSVVDGKVRSHKEKLRRGERGEQKVAELLTPVDSSQT